MISKFSFLKYSTTSSLSAFEYGVKIDNLFNPNFCKAFTAAVLGVVTFASGFAKFIFFFY